MSLFIGDLPRHQYVWVDRAFTRVGGSGLERAVWFGLVSHPGRVWGCTVLLECGAVYRNLPPYALAFCAAPGEWSMIEAQTWNCYGYEFTTHEYSYLSGCKVLVKVSEYAHGRMGEWHGEYLFTAAPIADGFSAYPEQAKEFSFIRLSNGRLTIQPTNHVLIEERSFTEQGADWPTDIRRQTEVYSCEGHIE